MCIYLSLWMCTIFKIFINVCLEDHRLSFILLRISHFMTMLHLRTPTSEFFQINMDTQADRMRTFLFFLFYGEYWTTSPQSQFIYHREVHHSQFWCLFLLWVYLTLKPQNNLFVCPAAPKVQNNIAFSWLFSLWGHAQSGKRIIFGSIMKVEGDIVGTFTIIIRSSDGPFDTGSYTSVWV